MSEASNRTSVQSNTLKDAFGDELELIAEDGSLELFTVKAEFKLGNQIYAALQSANMSVDDEVELFRVIEGDEGPQLETIEDDEEWETASEAYDDLLFADDERP